MAKSAWQSSPDRHKVPIRVQAARMDGIALPFRRNRLSTAAFHVSAGRMRPADGEKDGRQMAAGGRPTCNRRAANGSGHGWPTGQGMPFMESGSLFGAYAVSLAPRASPGTALANAYRNGIHERRFFIAAIPEHGRTANGTDGRKKPDGTAGRHDTGTSGKPPG